MKRSFKIRRKLRRFVYNYREKRGLYNAADTNIYHCSIQKAASSWFVTLFCDPGFLAVSNRPVYRPGKDYIGSEKLEQLNGHIPCGRIVSPLYIGYEDFSKLEKTSSYKAFYVMRDPRDFVVSHYFSARYTHGESPAVRVIREKLNSLSVEEGLTDRIIALQPYYDSMREWSKCTDPNVMLCKFEDLFGSDQIEMMSNLFNHLDVDLSDRKLRSLLADYSFGSISGRAVGQVDENSHYRSGMPGDWKNYFNDDHKNAMKQATGSLLVDLGYESNDEW